MSYSFSIKGETKALAKQGVASEFDKIAYAQPIHARDRAAVLANANAVIGLLADDDTKDVSVSCNGYVAWSIQGDTADVPLNSATISCSASHANRE
jgi:hypothetical protein